MNNKTELPCKVGTFGRFTSSLEETGFGFLCSTCHSKDGGTSYRGSIYYEDAIRGRWNFTGIHFEECEKPLLTKASFKEWARFMMEQLPNLDEIITFAYDGEVGLKISDSGWYLTGRYFPDNKGRIYTRAGLFPKPKPDYESMIGMFGEFWDKDYDGSKKASTWGYLSEYNPTSAMPFRQDANYCWECFEPGLPSLKVKDK